MKVIFAVAAVAMACLLLVVHGQVLPFLQDIPETSFDCADRIYGYYADVEADCQVFHICLSGKTWSFLCPNQTMFNQAYLICDFPENVDCGGSEQFYSLNENFGKVEDNAV